MKRLGTLVLVVLVAAACGSGSAAPRESVGLFMTRILREEINGQWSKQWNELTPGHQKLITRSQYVACSRAMGTNIGNGKEVFRVLAVQNDPIHVTGVPQKTAKLVTISFRRPGIAPLTYRLHAVAVGGRWTWILGNAFITQVEHGRCLDGSRLPTTSS
ncbi:MAG TPA: hypothetical protein VN770_08500 [Gaiellaceae bacterium]|nr:hypothetical protein [Gaiellaceae bacterium]